MIIRLKVNEFNKAIELRGWTVAETANKIGVSKVHLWRVRLPVDDPRYNGPGSEFIAGTMVALESPFEEFFFLSDPLRGRKNAGPAA